MFCRANAFACRPDTAVVNASKIPMTLPLQLDPQRHELGPRRMAQRRAPPSNTHAMDFIFKYQCLMGVCDCAPWPDMPTYRQILPSWNARRHETAAPRRLVSDKFAVF